jgi:hypothetical protein
MTIRFGKIRWKILNSDNYKYQMLAVLVQGRPAEPWHCVAISMLTWRHNARTQPVGEGLP